LSHEILCIVGAFVVSPNGSRNEQDAMVSSERSDRGLRAGQMDTRFPWELGRASCLHAKPRSRAAGRNESRRFGVPADTPDEETSQQRKVVSKPRETEGGEKGKGSLSLFIVPMRSGEPTP